MLITLVYVSFAHQDMTQDELLSILKVARENNAKLNVTGMLLYRDGFFIQALEGEDNVVAALYTKIQQDARHERIITVYRNEIEQRMFGNWTMGFNDLGAMNPADHPGLTDILTKPLTAKLFVDNPARTAQLLASFANQTYF